MCPSSKPSSVCSVGLALKALRFGDIFDVTKASKSMRRDGMQSGNVSINFGLLTTVPHSSFLQSGYLYWISSGHRSQKIPMTLLDWDTTALLLGVRLQPFALKRCGTTSMILTERGVIACMLNAGSEAMSSNFSAMRAESNISVLILS